MVKFIKHSVHDHVTCFIVFAFLLLVPQVLFSKEREEFHIQGAVEGSSGATAYLVDIGIFFRLKNNDVILDSCEIKDDKFYFKGAVDLPMICAIKIPDKTNTYRILILEPGAIEIQGSVKELHRSTIFSEGSENRIFDQYNREINELEEKLDFIWDHCNSVVSLHVLDLQLIRSTIDKDVAERYYSRLSEKIRKSHVGRVVGRRIEFMETNNLKVLPPYEGTDVNDNKISFEEFKGKYLIIDFWATWCQPCIAQMPKLTEAYEKYRNNLEIISVSLDRDIDLCKQKIDDLGMEWRQICDGKAGRGELPLMFGVSAIPRVIVVNDAQDIIYDSSHSEEEIHDVLNRIGKSDRNADYIQRKHR